MRRDGKMSFNLREEAVKEGTVGKFWGGGA